MLSQVSSNFKTVLKDSFELIKYLEHTYLPCKTLSEVKLLTADITSLYTNIDLNRLYAVLASLDLPDLVPLAQFVCDFNYFTYAGQVYHQTDGIAMGTNCAVHLANIYLGKLLDPIIRSHPNMRFYKRFIDDLFMIWIGPTDVLETFQRDLNALIPGIQFTFSDASHHAVFLDVNIALRSDASGHPRIHYWTYQKPLNRYSYITPMSSHPRSTLRGFIFGELKRYARLSSSPILYQFTKDKFYTRLLARGYSRSFLDSIFVPHSWFSRYVPPSAKKEHLLALVLPPTNRIAAHNIHSYVKQRKHSFRDLLPGSEAVMVNTRTPNIMSYLTRSYLTQAQIDLLPPNPSTDNWHSSHGVPSRSLSLSPARSYKDHEFLHSPGNFSASTDISGFLPLFDETLYSFGSSSDISGLIESSSETSSGEP